MARSRLDEVLAELAQVEDELERVAEDDDDRADVLARRRELEREAADLRGDTGPAYEPAAEDYSDISIRAASETDPTIDG